MYDPTSVCSEYCKYARLCDALTSRSHDTSGCKKVLKNSKDSLSLKEFEVWRSTKLNIHC